MKSFLKDYFEEKENKIISNCKIFPFKRFLIYENKNAELILVTNYLLLQEWHSIKEN